MSGSGLDMVEVAIKSTMFVFSDVRQWFGYGGGGYWKNYVCIFRCQAVIWIWWRWLLKALCLYFQMSGSDLDMVEMAIESTMFVFSDVMQWFGHGGGGYWKQYVCIFRCQAVVWIWWRWLLKALCLYFQMSGSSLDMVEMAIKSTMFLFSDVRQWFGHGGGGDWNYYVCIFRCQAVVWIWWRWLLKALCLYFQMSGSDSDMVEMAIESTMFVYSDVRQWFGHGGGGYWKQYVCFFRCQAVVWIWWRWPLKALCLYFQMSGSGLDMVEMAIKSTIFVFSDVSQWFGHGGGGYWKHYVWIFRCQAMVCAWWRWPWVKESCFYFRCLVWTWCRWLLKALCLYFQMPGSGLNMVEMAIESTMFVFQMFGSGLDMVEVAIESTIFVFSDVRQWFKHGGGGYWKHYVSIFRCQTVV